MSKQPCEEKDGIPNLPLILQGDLLKLQHIPHRLKRNAL